MPFWEIAHSTMNNSQILRAPSSRLETQRLQGREIGSGRGRGPQAPELGLRTWPYWRKEVTRLKALEKKAEALGIWTRWRSPTLRLGILGIVWGWISTTGSVLIMDWNLVLPKLFFSHRDFAASRLRVIPLISHEGHRRREEAMIADLRHDPAMKKELPFTLCVLCGWNVVIHWLCQMATDYNHRDKRA